MFYATYRVLNSLMPRFADDWRAMMTSVGLDPSDTSTNLATAVGIGNRAGNAVVAARQTDGMNELGNEGGKRYNRRPYEDYTGYTPVNSPYELLDPSRWQPLLVTPGNGTFSAQHFVTPQWSKTRPYSYRDPDRFSTPVPHASDVHHWQAYKAQADEVRQAQANLTDTQKMTAELFDNKISGSIRPGPRASARRTRRRAAAISAPTTSAGRSACRQAPPSSNRASRRQPTSPLAHGRPFRISSGTAG
jgi:hypothetical protein